MSFNINDPIHFEIARARVRMLIDNPFFGTLTTRLDLQDASEWCRTVCTDGKFLYFNRDYVKGITFKELQFVVAHNIMHLAYEHPFRRGSREKDVWDMACDYAVNATLVASNVGTPPAGALIDRRYNDDMTAEEIYADLIKRSVKVELPMDEHMDPEGDPSDGNGEGNAIRVINTDGDGPPALTQEEIDKLRNQMRAAMIQASSIVGAGNVPAGIRRMVKSLTESVINWRELLSSSIKSTLSFDTSFTRSHRRNYNNTYMRPGNMEQTTIDIAVAIDASGSMTDEMLRDLLGEVQGIMQTFTDFRLFLFSFDDDAYGLKEFNQYNLDEIMEYDIKGGGGTRFSSCWEYMIKNEIKPERFVMFTDGYDFGDCGYSHKDYCETLFIIHGGFRKFDPKFGSVAHYEDALPSKR